MAHDHWRSALGALVRSGADIIIDEMFLGAAADQARWQETFDGLRVLWVGVQCDIEVAVGRETARGDRTPNMARSQAAVVHEDVDYDIVVDTTRLTPAEAADAVVGELERG